MNGTVTESEYWWGVIPAFVGIVASALSVRAAFVSRRWVQFLASGMVIGLVVFSIVLLYRIFIEGAWPIVVPHIAIGFSMVVAVVQFRFRQRKGLGGS